MQITESHFKLTIDTIESPEELINEIGELESNSKTNLIVDNALIAWIRLLSMYNYSSPLSRLSFEQRWYLTVTSKLAEYRRLFDFEMLDPDAAWYPRVVASPVVSECGRMRVPTNLACL